MSKRKVGRRSLIWKKARRLEADNRSVHTSVRIIRRDNVANFSN
ncbi:MAG: hypothetical protein O7C58_02560 [Rickettsia endosymbiont of Ixodes persulcatus]|nr:hypothetical protein [Rickettsia endosymbiont of Ixodes persulcatus]MCZ6903031.1 hypothetical protein [Rickettsia endosymbiont of Ixodes persulcatus]MCZ6908295.1 hypothetical protein [Rickettsia endosymbiont of Ixodes persulcatus]